MPYIIVDRDGVINHDSHEYIKSPEEWLPIPGSLEAIAALNRAGFKVFIVTNQSGIARGYFDLKMLNRIHEKLTQQLAARGGHIEEIFFCPHHPDEHCVCRKPKPGLLYQLRDKYKLNLNESYFIGDSYADVLVAKTAGCKPLLVLTGNGTSVLAHHPEIKEDVPYFADLKTAVAFVLASYQLIHD